MKFKCCKCNEMKGLDGYDEKWFKVVKKVCLKCEVKGVERRMIGEIGRREAERLREKERLENQIHQIKTRKVDTGAQNLFKSDKWGKVWMKEGDKQTAYRRAKKGFIPYRTFTSKFTQQPTIKVKWTTGDKYYPVEKMYEWIFNQ